MTVTLGQYTIGTKDEGPERGRESVKGIGRLLSERNSTMKDFYENDNRNENENVNVTNDGTRENVTAVNDDTKNAATTGTTGTTENADTTAATDTTASANGTTDSAPVQDTTPHAPVENPYLTTQQGGANPASAQQNTAPQSSMPQNPYGGNQSGTQQNPYSGSQSGSPYGQNPYTAQQNGGNPYGQYQPYQQYQPHQGEISYRPAPQKKARKNGKAGFVALAVVGGILLSTGFGFIGSALGNQYFAPSESSVVTPETTGSANGANTPTVIYKGVDTVTTSTTADGGDLTSAQVAAMVKDSVVEINTEYTTVSMWYQYVSGGAGSGVIISEDGYIITNNHVICGSDGTTVAEKITVRLTDGSEYNATVVGTDADADIAIIKIDKTGLTPAVMGDSDKLSVGEDVIAVGNPLGELGGSVTNGIISALDREISVNGVEMNLLQTNAAVNPGNSGGGLFNMRGELIGVVNAKSSGEGVEGLGFAIPVNDAMNVAEQLMQYGYVKGKVIIGIGLVDITDASMARYLGLSGYGTYITEVTKGYNDDVLQVGDRIISVNGEEISSRDDVTAIVKKASVGDKLTFQVSRQGKITEVEVTCYEKVPETAETGLPITRG